MKFKSWAAAVVSAAVTVCSMSTLVFSSAEEAAETTTYTVTYSFDAESLTDTEDVDLTLYESFELEAGEYVDIPDQDLYNEPGYLSGWSYDGIYLYEPGDFFKMPEHDVVLEAVWVDTSLPTRTVSFHYEEEGWAVTGDDAFQPIKVRPNAPLPAPSTSIMRDDYTQIGWRWGDIPFSYPQKIIMPNEDITLEPNWYRVYSCYYEAGDVDRISGSKMFVFGKYETHTFDLADSSRIARSGFNLSGWLCDVDGQTYKTGSQYTMPSSDVHFTAVWEPKTYNVVFKVNNGTSNTYKISGKTDETIIAPECTYKKNGYVFAGWNYKGTIYQPGDEFIIPGALPGLGIQLTGVWEEERNDNSLTLVQARQKFVNGEITEDELREIADYVLGK